VRSRLARLLAFRPDPVLVRLLGAVLALAALTAFLSFGMDRLEPVPGARALRPLAAEGSEASVRTYPAAGRVELSPDAALLDSPGSTGSVALRVTVPSGAPLAGLRVAVELAAERITPAEGWSAGGHLRLVGRSAAGTLLFGRELHVARLVGTRSPFRLRRDVALPAGAVGATLEVELVRAAGRLLLRDLTLAPLRHRPAFGLARAALIAGWIVLGGWTVLRLLGTLRTPWLATALGIATTVAIVLLVLPREPEQQMLAEAARLLGLGGVEADALGDLGHVLIFALLALVAVGAVRTLPPAAVLLALAAAAPVAEYVQLLTDGRSADPADALRNLVGVALGGGLGLLLRRLPLPGAPAGRGRLP
jgi:hypothetical protein